MQRRFSQDVPLTKVRFVGRVPSGFDSADPERRAFNDAVVATEVLAGFAAGFVPIIVMLAPGVGQVAAEISLLVAMAIYLWAWSHCFRVILRRPPRRGDRFLTLFAQRAMSLRPRYRRFREEAWARP